jgi:hypothetical protein
VPQRCWIEEGYAKTLRGVITQEDPSIIHFNVIPAKAGTHASYSSASA